MHLLKEDPQSTRIYFQGKRKMKMEEGSTYSNRISTVIATVKQNIKKIFEKA